MYGLSRSNASSSSSSFRSAHVCGSPQIDRVERAFMQQRVADLLGLMGEVPCLVSQAVIIQIRHTRRDGIQVRQDFEAGEGSPAAQQLRVVHTPLVEKLVFPAPGDMAGVIVFICHRTVPGDRVPEARQVDAFYRPERSQTAGLDEIDRIIKRMQSPFGRRAVGLSPVSSQTRCEGGSLGHERFESYLSRDMTCRYASG